MNEAAELYSAAESYEKAVMLYIHMKAMDKAQPLIARITAPRILLQYAKAREALKQYAEAVEVYKRAADTDSVVRLYLNHLNQPEAAFEIVRQSHSTVGATLIAEYCQKHQLYDQAIEFLMAAGMVDEAFTLSKQLEANKQMADAVQKFATLLQASKLPAAQLNT